MIDSKLPTGRAEEVMAWDGLISEAKTQRAGPKQPSDPAGEVWALLPRTSDQAFSSKLCRATVVGASCRCVVAVAVPLERLQLTAELRSSIVVLHVFKCDESPNFV